MSDKGGEGGNQGGAAPNKAQSEFERYKARLGTMQPAMAVPWGMPPGGIPGWTLPASAAPGQFAPPAFPSAGQAASAAAQGLTAKLGDTVRLGVELLNTALASGASALSASLPGASGHWTSPHHHGCGCSCCAQSCGCPSCCEVMSCHPCCSPGVHGCC